MTISSTPSEIAYAGDGVSTGFPVPFPFDTSADLKVLRTNNSTGSVETLTTGFSVSGGNGSTGTVLFSTAPESGYTITILDNPELTQPTDYTANDAFPAETHERALDRTVRQIKRKEQQISRAMRTADGDPITDLTLGSVDNRKGKFLFFNAITGAIEYALALASETLSQSIIGQFLNPQSDAEANAGVTPVNYFYDYGNAFRYMQAAEIVNVRARTATTDVRDSLQNWLDCGHSKLKAPDGKYRVAGKLTLTRTGVTIEGESDYNTEFVADGSTPWLQIGDDSYSLIEHTTLQNVTHIAGENFAGDCLIKTKQCFQTYFDRVRYKRTLNHPADAIYIMDNHSGESELPVRVTFRDSYIDAANYAVGAPAVPCPCAIWLPSAIQVVIDNTHIQDAEIGIKVGYNPATDTNYAGSNDDAYDISFINNSRYQVGDRGDTTTFARAFDVWKGGHLVIDNAQIYLNNNGPDPALASQRIAKFNGEWTDFSMTNTEVNFNSRSEHAFEVAATGNVGRLSLSGNNFGAQVADKDLILVQPGGEVKAVIDPSNHYSNPNSNGAQQVITNAGSATLSLGDATGVKLVYSDGTARNIAAFSNGVPGVEYLVQVVLSGGSTLTIATVTPATATGIVFSRGWPGILKLYDGDLIKVRRVDDPGTEKYYIDVLGADVSETLASAASLTLPVRTDVFVVTGTTNVDSIGASGQNGRRITLIFDNTLTVGDGTGNLNLEGNFVTSNTDSITLVCAGSNWYEVGRSNN